MILGENLTRIQESIIAKILVSRVERIQVDSHKRKCKIHKWRRVYRFSQKSLQESKWILATLDEILPPVILLHPFDTFTGVALGFKVGGPG